MLEAITRRGGWPGTCGCSALRPAFLPVGIAGDICYATRTLGPCPCVTAGCFMCRAHAPSAPISVPMPVPVHMPTAMPGPVPVLLSVPVHLVPLLIMPVPVPVPVSVPPPRGVRTSAQQRTSAPRSLGTGAGGDGAFFPQNVGGSGGREGGWSCGRRGWPHVGEMQRRGCRAVGSGISIPAARVSMMAAVHAIQRGHGSAPGSAKGISTWGTLLDIDGPGPHRRQVTADGALPPLGGHTDQRE